MMDGSYDQSATCYLIWCPVFVNLKLVTVRVGHWTERFDYFQFYDFQICREVNRWHNLKFSRIDLMRELAAKFLIVCMFEKTYENSLPVSTRSMPT